MYYYSVLNFFASAQNAIDGDGGFVALTPNGNVDNDGWPLGENMIMVHYQIYMFGATATNYVATGGSGWIDLDNNNLMSKQQFI